MPNCQFRPPPNDTWFNIQQFAKVNMETGGQCLWPLGTHPNPCLQCTPLHIGGLPSNLGKSRQAGSRGGKATNPGNLPQIRVIYYEIWVTKLRRVRFPGNLWCVLVIRVMVLKFQNLWRRLRAFLFWRWFNTGAQIGSISPWKKLHQDHQTYIWPTNILKLQEKVEKSTLRS